MPKQPLEQLEAPTRARWREWLTAHHATSPGVWLVIYKRHTGRQWTSYEEAVEEAVCFGWVDSSVRRRDGDTYLQRFGPRRKKKTHWSKSNLQRARRLIDAGLMTEAGLATLGDALERPDKPKSPTKNAVRPPLRAHLRCRLPRFGARIGSASPAPKPARLLPATPASTTSATPLVGDLGQGRRLVLPLTPAHSLWRTGSPPGACLRGVLAAATALTLAATPGAGLAAEGATSHLDQIRSLVAQGGDVAILPGDDLVAVSADGRRRRVLAPGPVPWCLLDNRAQTVWFGRPLGDGAVEVWVLDLLGAGPPVGVVARFGWLPEIEYPAAGKAKRTLLALGHAEMDVAVRLTLGPQGPRLSPQPGGTWCAINEDSCKALPAAIERVRLKHTPVLRRLAARAAKRNTPAPGTRPPTRPRPKRVPIPAGACEYEDLCGTAEPVGNTRYVAVVVSHSCGDGCYTEAMLYDPSRRRFVDALDPRKTYSDPSKGARYPEDARVAPRDAAYIGGGRLVRFDRGLVEVPGAGGSGGGWLRDLPEVGSPAAP